MLLIVEIDILVDTFNLNIVLIIGFSSNYSIIDINLLLSKKHIVIVKQEHLLNTFYI